MATISCCPPNSEPFLAPSYVTSGSTTSIDSGDITTEFYQSGSSDSGKGVLVIPDVYGWHGGRTRNIADYFAEQGYYAIVPKLLVPPFEDGTDGDGLPPDFNFAGGQFGPYITTVTWQEVVKPRIGAVISHMQAAGVTKIAAVGFCWGGLMVTHTLIDFADVVVVGASPHPSITIEAMFFKRDVVTLVSQIKRPMLLLPAGNDGDTYRPGGEIYEAIKGAQPASETLPTEFAEMTHGWVPRGDIENPVVKAAVEAALKKISEYFSANMA